VRPAVVADGEHPDAGAPPPLVAVVGATGTGKSALSLELAERWRARGVPAEIVNADAMQLYRGMDVGTAKLTVEERRGVPHHLIDVLDVVDEASVAAYQRAARVAAEDIRSRGGVPIVVGGSGLYVSSLVFDLDFPGTDDAVRARLERELDELGHGELHRRLASVDPDAASAIDPRNHRRLVRALEVVELTGRPYAASLPDPAPVVPTVIVGLRAPRDVLTARLDARTVGMWDAGLLDEVRGLVPLGLERGPTASRAIGYAQALAQLRGEVDRDRAIAETQQLTRRYARRQLAWFGRYRHVHWLDFDDPELAERAFALGRSWVPASARLLD